MRNESEQLPQEKLRVCRPFGRFRAILHPPRSLRTVQGLVTASNYFGCHKFWSGVLCRPVPR